MQDKLERAKALHQQGQVREATRLYQEILKDDPSCADALHHLGVAALQVGQAGQAARLIRQALDLQPEEAGYWGHFGIALTQLNELDSAIAAYKKAIELNPRNAEALSNLGNTLQRQGRLDQAIAVYRLAMRVAPRYAQAAYNLGIALKAKGELSEAAQAYRTAIAAKPDYDRALINLGNVLQELGEYEEALKSFHSALEINPQLPKGYANLASLQLEMGDIEAAMTGYQRALSLQPNDADTQYNRAQALLLQGAFDEGWDAHECRFRSSLLAEQARELTAPTWTGEALAGRNLFVWSEQGIDDQILFAGLLADLERKDGSVSVDCDEPLVSLFRRSFPGLSFEPAPKPTTERSTASGLDFQIALGSLGRLLRRSETDFPRHAGYLKPDPAKVQAFIERLHDKAGERTAVGISWSNGVGRTRPARDAALQQWAPILLQESCCFVSLVQGAAAEEIAGATQAMGIEILTLPDVDPHRDLDSLAALLASLDLTITLGDGMAHMAGALGQQAWVLLPLVPSWHWMLGREDSPWYPSLRLFRQERRDDWAPVIERVADELKRFTS